MNDLELPEATETVEKLLGDDHLELDRLLGALHEVLDNANYSAVFERLDLFWARLAMHIRAENLHLFPEILSGFEVNRSERNDLPAFSDVHKAIAQLTDDHNFFMHELADAIKAVRARINGSQSEVQKLISEVRSSILAISKRLESHNLIEENFIYRIPAQLLTREQHVKLANGVRRELQNLPPRFSDPQT